jgi:hypothetical protein
MTFRLGVLIWLLMLISEVNSLTAAGAKYEPVLKLGPSMPKATSVLDRMD